MQRLVLRKTAAKTSTLRSLLSCGTLLSSLYLCSSALAAQAPGTQQAQQAQQQWLLQQMRVGEAMFREELFNDALARLELIAPNHPQVLVGKIRQALRAAAALPSPLRGPVLCSQGRHCRISSATGRGSATSSAATPAK